MAEMQSATAEIRRGKKQKMEETTGQVRSARSPKGGGERSTLSNLRVEVIVLKLDRKCGALPVVASFVALEQQIILVKTRSESV